MTPTEIIKQVEDVASEYLEMTEKPAELVAGILANRIVGLHEYIEYLENRLEHVGNTRIN